MTAPFWMRGTLKWTFFSLKIVGPDWSKCRPVPLFFFNFNRKGSVISKEHCVHGIMGIADKPVTGRSSEGRRPVENSENSGHSSQHFGGLHWRGILQTEWQTCKGGQMGKTRDYLFLYFVPPPFLPFSFPWPGNRSQCVTLTDVSIPKMHLEDAGGGITCCSGREWCECARFVEDTNQSMKAALCFLSRAKSEYKLITLFKTTNLLLTQ